MKPNATNSLSSFGRTAVRFDRETRNHFGVPTRRDVRPSLHRQFQLACFFPSKNALSFVLRRSEVTARREANHTVSSGQPGPTRPTSQFLRFFAFCENPQTKIALNLLSDSPSLKRFTPFHYKPLRSGGGRGGGSMLAFLLHILFLKHTNAQCIKGESLCLPLKEMQLWFHWQWICQGPILLFDYFH